MAPGKKQTTQETHGFFSPNLVKEIYSLEEFLEEFTKACSRFRSPFSRTDLLELAAAKRTANSRVFKNLSVVSHHTIPSNWQALLNYLYQEKILAFPEFKVISRSNDLPAVCMTRLASAVDVAKTDGHVRRPAYGFGSSLTLEEAYSKAVGELLERHRLTIYKRGNFLHASYAELAGQGKNVLNPDNLNAFLPWQKETYPQYQHDADSKFFWTKGVELLSGKKAYIPAQLVFWNYKHELGEPMLVQPTTNGAAGGFTFEETALGALYEGVQRDSFLMFWLNTISPPIIDLNLGSIEDQNLRALLESFKQFGMQIFFLDTTSDIEIPSCICVLLDERSGEPQIAVGGGAGFALEKNLLSSALEALSVRNSFSDKVFSLPSNYHPFSNKPPIGRDERIPLWKGKVMFEEFRFFVSGKRTPIAQTRFAHVAREFESVEEEYEHVLGIFRSKGPGYEVYCYSAEDPALSKLGYCVAKVVVPQLLPLYLDEHMATLDSPRLQNFPEFVRAHAAVNPWPHPFP